MSCYRDSLGDLARLLVTILFCSLGLIGCSDDGPVKPPAGVDPVEVVIPAWDYLDNRFFRLDLPPLAGDLHLRLGYQIPDVPGRPDNAVIDAGSVRVYRLIGVTTPEVDDIQYVAATIDTTGLWTPESIEAIPLGHWEHAMLWRPVTLTSLLDVTDDLWAIDLLQQMQHDDVLAVTYDVVDRDTRELLYRVGEDPHNDAPRGLTIGDWDFYRMKMLKPANRDPFTFQYVLRNIYSLGRAGINMESFDLRLERAQSQSSQDSTLHTESLTYLQVFGLDLFNDRDEPGSDGAVDVHRPYIFDLASGLLRFPQDFPFPFNAGEAAYHEYAMMADPDADWPWSSTYLATFQTPAIYEWSTHPSNYSQHPSFNIIAVYDTTSTKALRRR